MYDLSRGLELYTRLAHFQTLLVLFIILLHVRFYNYIAFTQVNVTTESYFYTHQYELIILFYKNPIQFFQFNSKTSPLLPSVAYMGCCDTKGALQARRYAHKHTHESHLRAVIFIFSLFIQQKVLHISCVCKVYRRTCNRYPQHFYVHFVWNNGWLNGG